MKKSILFSVPIVLALASVSALADDQPELDGQLYGSLERPDPNLSLELHDLATQGIVSDGPSAKVNKNLATAGRGVRLLPNATTDVWTLDKFTYIGTFGTPCGDGTGDNGSGIQVFYTSNPNKPLAVGSIPSVAGSRSNDVKVASMNSGDILVHSNESCAGGPGGFEIYNVDFPNSPQYLASVRIDELNPISNALFGGISDVGVHNLWLFTQGENDYVAAVAGTAFDNFQIYDITDPANPVLISAWGAEEIFDPGVGDEVADVNRVLAAALDLLSGVGASQNKFLHDATISADGTRAYLSNWDAGLVLLDISDPANPVFISAAIDPAGSLDGEVNSHAAWPNADGSIVVEGEEDFSAWEGNLPPTNLTMDSSVPGDPTIPGTAIATSAGDDFEASQTGNDVTVIGTSVTVNSGPLAGNIYPAAELSTAALSPTFGDTGPLTGEAVFIGQACPGDPVLNAADVDPGDIAVVRRGACFFEDKENTAASLGAAAVVIANNQPGTPWSGLRIWDYSDPADPTLLSTFNTECSAAASPGAGCDPAGTYSAHNVQVDGDKVYVSWYSDGVLVLDISDPSNPVETARFKRAGPDFEAANGGMQDIWGVYKDGNKPWVYASDRNGGLYVLKEYGAGSAKVAKKD